VKRLAALLPEALVLLGIPVAARTYSATAR
jgi:hypothetical protein